MPTSTLARLSNHILWSSSYDFHTSNANKDIAICPEAQTPQLKKLLNFQLLHRNTDTTSSFTSTKKQIKKKKKKKKTEASQETILMKDFLKDHDNHNFLYLHRTKYH